MTIGQHKNGLCPCPYGSNEHLELSSRSPGGGSRSVALQPSFSTPHQFVLLLSYRDPEAAGALSAYVLIAAALRWTYPFLWPKHTRSDSQYLSRNVTMPVRFVEKLWTVRLQSGATAGARSLTGGYDVRSQSAGIWLDSDGDDHLFIPMDTSELPTETELKQMTVDAFAQLYHRAKHV